MVIQCLTHSKYSGLAIITKMATIVVVVLISMIAKAESFDLQSASEKSTGVKQNKLEIRALTRPGANSIEQCGQILSGVTNQSDQVKRVRKTLKKNLHFHPFGSGHMILKPGWYADQSGIVAAHSAMNEDDIPVFVSLIGREELEGEIRGMGILVLGMFGEKALPCIEAGMAMYPEQASALFGVKDSIEYNRQSQPKP